MKLSSTLHNQIVEFLTSIPMLQNSSGRRALIYSAVLDPQLQNQISFTEPPAQFVQLLVTILSQYGKLEDGRNALEAVLEAAKEYVGQEGKNYCDRLIQEVHTATNRKEQNLGSLSLKYTLIIIIVSLLSLNTIMSAKAFWEQIKVEEYQKAIQEIDDLINRENSGIKKFRSEEENETIYEDSNSNIIARDYFHSENMLYLREFYDGDRIIARDIFEKDENGQWYKKRVHFDENKEAFIQEYFSITGVLQKKGYDKNRDGIYVERVARFLSPFPPVFFQFYR